MVGPVGCVCAWVYDLHLFDANHKHEMRKNVAKINETLQFHCVSHDNHLSNGFKCSEKRMKSVKKSTEWNSLSHRAISPPQKSLNEFFHIFSKYFERFFPCSSGIGSFVYFFICPQLNASNSKSPTKWAERERETDEEQERKKKERESRTVFENLLAKCWEFEIRANKNILTFQFSLLANVVQIFFPGSFSFVGLLICSLVG